MKTSLSLVFIFLTSLVNAQDPCATGNNGIVFQANRIGAFFSPRGSKFLDEKSHGFFKVPYTSEKSASTIFASSPWIGGYVNGTLSLAGPEWPIHNQDYYVGPLRPGAVPLNECLNFDKAWSISRGEIEEHIQDFMDDGIIQDTVSAVFGWPAEGNDFFPAFNGFELPADHIGGWADFADLNKNGVYEPQFGEYPQITLKGNPQNPEMIAWMVFNDQGPHQVSQGLPLGVEIQLTVFGFLCDHSDVLNNTLFNTYKIINQNQDNIDSLYFGMWSDYDLGCANDDYLGCDSVRNTEFVYNDAVDGNINFECETGSPTYGNFPPVQSFTYLSQPMHSFVMNVRNLFGIPIYPEFMNAEEQYHLLTGNWADGSPIYASGYGIYNSQDGPKTKFFLHGDPRDTAQWSWLTSTLSHIDALPVSSVYLNRLQPGEQTIVETAYSFHQDSTLNNLEQVGFMYSNIDSLLEIIDDIGSFCQPPPVCTGKECVWPGDFNHNGIADHYDLLYWGVMKEQEGSRRDGKINWQGHYADNWSLTIPANINSKHGDGNGDGSIDEVDLDRNEHHFLYTNPYHVKDDQFPEGPELSITSNSMTPEGKIRNIHVKANIPIENVLGLAYELEYDTTFFILADELNAGFVPSDTHTIMLSVGKYEKDKPTFVINDRYAYVKSNHEATPIEQGFQFQRSYFGLMLKDNVSYDDLPDTTVLRLKNLIALDPNGNDLHIGSTILRVPKNLSTSIEDSGQKEVFVFPNPANNVLYVNTDIAQSASVLSVLGTIVKVISAGQLSQPIDLSSLSPGVYFLKLEKSGGTMRFIKL